MVQRSIPGFCERCGQRFDLAQPAPGERDLGLDPLQATFRYCSSCQLYVGRTCCWNPDAVACIVDAPPFAPSATLLAPKGSSKELVALRGIAELAAALDAVEHLDDLKGLSRQADIDREIGRRAWDDVWWKMGWLIARAESSRDAAAKALRHASVHPGSFATEDLTSQLTSLVERYGRDRAKIEARLVAAGKSLISADRRKPPRAILRMVQSALVGAGALLAILVLTFGPAALSNGDPVSSLPEGGLLGGAGGPGQSRSAASTPAPHAPTAVIARMDFDELRIGPLAGSSDQVNPVVGGPEVVAYPSPFDRSLRVVGKGSHRFCVPTPNLDEARVSFVMSLYSETRVISGGLKLSVAPSGVGPTMARVPLKLLDGLPLKAWHRLLVVWGPLQPAAITVGDEPVRKVETASVATAHDAQAIAGAVCVEVSGMAAGAMLLLDNLRVEQ